MYACMVKVHAVYCMMSCFKLMLCMVSLDCILEVVDSAEGTNVVHLCNNGMDNGVPETVPERTQL